MPGQTSLGPLQSELSCPFSSFKGPGIGTRLRPSCSRSQEPEEEEVEKDEGGKGEGGGGKGG
eukprot:1177709-Pyramimonas_sp.AAC.1